MIKRLAINLDSWVVQHAISDILKEMERIKACYANVHIFILKDVGLWWLKEGDYGCQQKFYPIGHPADIVCGPPEAEAFMVRCFDLEWEL